MTVCDCHRGSTREIAHYPRAGMGFEAIQFEPGLATQCGQCEGCAQDVVAPGGTCPTANIKLASNLPEGSAWQT